MEQITLIGMMLVDTFLAIVVSVIAVCSFKEITNKGFAFVDRIVITNFLLCIIAYYVIVGRLN